MVSVSVLYTKCTEHVYTKKQWGCLHWDADIAEFGSSWVRLMRWAISCENKLVLRFQTGLFWVLDPSLACACPLCIHAYGMDTHRPMLSFRWDNCKMLFFREEMMNKRSSSWYHKKVKSAYPFLGCPEDHNVGMDQVNIT